MRLLLLSTCGTSLLTNGSDAQTRRWLVDKANDKMLPQKEEDRLKTLLEDRRTQLKAANPDKKRDMSAEYNGISACLDRWHPEQVQHLLLHTDTAVGKAAAQLVEEMLRVDGASVFLQTSAGLRTDDLLDFRAALTELTLKLETDLQDWRNQGWTIVFNLTGSFKSLNGYLQALGMIHADHCAFLFERARDLMVIPRLPVQLAEQKEIEKHLWVFRRLAVGYSVSTQEAEGVPGSLLDELDGKVMTSVWGDVVWARTQKHIYQTALLPPLSDKLQFSDKLRRTVRRLPGDRLAKVNEALDALAAQVDKERKHLKSETFKKLKGNPRPPSTHEMYAWSDDNASRLLGHYDNGTFIIDDLVEHL